MDGGRWTVVGRPDCRSESGLLTLQVDSCTAVRVGVDVDVDVGIAGVGEPVGRVVSFKTRFVSRNLKGLSKIPTVFLLFIASSEPEAEQ